MRTRPTPLAFALAAVVLLAGCQRKDHNPLLSTPDPLTTQVRMFVRGLDNSNRPDLSVLLQSVANGSIRMTDLKLNNFAVLQDEVPLIPTRFERAGSYPFAVMIVMDRSGSMDTADFSGGTRKQGVNDAAVVFLNNLPASAQAGLVEFDTNVQLTVPLTTNRETVIAAVSSSTFGTGNTAIYDAIIAGAQELSKGTGLRLLIVLTDGEDNSSHYTPTEAIAALRSIGTVASGVIIAGDVSNTAILQSIVDSTGGRLSTSLNAAQLAADLSATLTGGAFDDIYALTFRRRNNEPNLQLYVSYGANTDHIDLSLYR